MGLATCLVPDPYKTGFRRLLGRRYSHAQCLEKCKFSFVSGGCFGVRIVRETQVLVDDRLVRPIVGRLLHDRGSSCDECDCNPQPK